MRTFGRILFLLSAVVAPLASQARIDWRAKEAAVYQAVVDVNVDALAANLDSAYVGIYPRGMIDREAQMAAVRGEWKSFELSQFTAREIDSQTVLLTYRLITQGANSGTFWASTLWRPRSGGDHRFVDSLGSVLTGRVAAQEGWRQYLQIVPDYHIDVNRFFTDGPDVVLVGTARGTYSRDGQLHPGHAWQTPAAWRAVVRNGAVAEWQVYADNEPIRQRMARASVLS